MQIVALYPTDFYKTDSYLKKVLVFIHLCILFKAPSDCQVILCFLNYLGVIFVLQVILSRKLN